MFNPRRVLQKENTPMKIALTLRNTTPIVTKIPLYYLPGTIPLSNIISIVLLAWIDFAYFNV